MQAASGIKGGSPPVVVSQGGLESDSENVIIKTTEIPGWFQIGEPEIAKAIATSRAITNYKMLK